MPIKMCSRGFKAIYHANAGDIKKIRSSSNTELRTSGEW